MAVLGKVVLASANLGKLQEIKRLLANTKATVVAQSELGISEAPEPHATFLENALAKARNAAIKSGLPAIADDSGLCVDALGGKPGVHSARFAGPASSDSENNLLLLEKMQGAENRLAQFHCVVVYCRSADDPRPIFVEGVWQGKIANNQRGEGGFGYDVLFELENGRTAAELSATEKDNRSHRGMAFKKLLGAILTAQ